MITRQDFNNFVDKGFNIIPIAKKIYKDNETPQFNAFRVDAKQPIQLPLKIISNKGFSSLDLGNTNADPEKLKEQEEIKSLNDRIHNIIEGSQNKYEKLPPKDGELNSGFSTFA